MDTTLTIKLPKKLHQEAKKTANQLGLPLTTVTNALLRQFVLDKEITLSIKRPNASLASAIKELENGKGKRFTGSTDDFFSMLEKA